MIVEYIRYHVAEEQGPALEQAYTRASEALRQSPHCLAYELARCTEEPASYILRIQWDSVEGHLQGFRRSPEFQSFFRAISPFVNAIQEMRHYEVTAVADSKR
jgi:quinol monooxygenase YgiN